MSLFESLDRYANYIDRVYEEAKAHNHGERSRDLKGTENERLIRGLREENERLIRGLRNKNER